MTSQDKKNNWGTPWRAAVIWCILCIVFMVVVPTHVIFRTEMPVTVQNIYVLVAVLSPLPYYLISTMTKKSIRDDSDPYFPKKKGILILMSDPKSQDKLESFRQLCIVSLAIISPDHIFHIQWLDWLTVIWILTIVISTLLSLTKRNRNS